MEQTEQEPTSAEQTGQETSTAKQTEQENTPKDQGSTTMEQSDQELTAVIGAWEKLKHTKHREHTRSQGSGQETQAHQFFPW